MITFQGWGMGRKGLWSLFLPQMLVCVCVCVCVHAHACVLQASSLLHAVCLSACPSSLPSHLSPAHPELLEGSGPGWLPPSCPRAQSWAQES